MLKSNNGDNSLIGKNFADTIPFSANRIRTKFKIRYWLRDSNERDGRSKSNSIIFESPTGTNFKDLKVFLAITKIAIDNNELLVPSQNAKIHPSIKAMRDIECLGVDNISTRELCKMLEVRTTRKERESIVHSIKILSHLSTEINIKGSGIKYLNWIYAPIKIDNEENYETVSFSISRIMLKSVLDDGLVYNFKKTMKYSGRALLLYVHMQTRKYKKGRKYFYNNYIKNSDLIIALDLITADSKEQKRQIARAFKKLEEENNFPKYEFISNKNYWKKITNKTLKVI